MKANTEKFDSLVSNKTSGWHKAASERISNKTWQEKAFEIALIVISHMRENKITQVSLAKEMGVTPQYINKILQGKENMTLETICRIEDTIGIKLIEIEYSNSETYKFEVAKPIFSGQFSAKSIARLTVDLDTIGYEKHTA